MIYFLPSDDPNMFVMTFIVNGFALARASSSRAAAMEKI
jgi:hypothetical protein